MVLSRTFEFSTECPEGSVLYLFMQGKLSDEEFEAVLAHVDTCVECQSQIDQLAIDDFGFQSAPQRLVDQFEGEPALQRLVKFAVGLGDSISANLPNIVDVHRTKIGPYEIIEQLGQGGMGTVYKARHPRLKRVVAIKIIKGSSLRNRSATARFEREIEAIGQLDHRHIMRASDAGEDDGLLYLVMEFVDGHDLAQLVTRCGALPVADACELIRQAAIGLQVIHEHGLVHRDIKPSNLMLARVSHNGEPDAIVKILDLGLAMLEGEGGNPGEALTSSGQVLGTVDYMAPEQAEDTRRVDIRADIYSLGATLYKLLSTHSPIPRTVGPGILQRLRAVASEPASPLSEFRNDIPRDLQSFVDRLLAKDPEDRVQTPGEVVSQLGKFCENSRPLELLSPNPVPVQLTGQSDNLQHVESAESATPVEVNRLSANGWVAVIAIPTCIATWYFSGFSFGRKDDSRPQPKPFAQKQQDSEVEQNVVSDANIEIRLDSAASIAFAQELRTIGSSLTIGETIPLKELVGKHFGKNVDIAWLTQHFPEIRRGEFPVSVPLTVRNETPGTLTLMCHVLVTDNSRDWVEATELLPGESMIVDTFIHEEWRAVIGERVIDLQIPPKLSIEWRVN